MKLLIDIDKVYYEVFSTCRYTPLTVLESTLMNAVGSGKPIPDNATNLDVLKTVFPNTKVDESEKGFTILTLKSEYRGEEYEESIAVWNHWCNAPYRKE